MYVDVLVEIKAKALDQVFTYKMGDNKVEAGSRVLVPFGNQKLEGFVLKISDSYDGEFKLKNILEVIDKQPILNEELLKLGEYISKKTLSTKIHSYQTMLPSALKAKKNFSVNKKYKSYFLLNINFNEAIEMCKNDKQKEIISFFKEQNKIEKNKLTNISISSVTTLCKNNILKEIKEDCYRIENEDNIIEDNIVLNNLQKSVVNEVLRYNNFKPFLLHGVTGSGKTEVYIKIIKEVLKQNKTALVLVPEISLTPQFTEIFKKRFGNDIAILHSRLSDGEKYDEWRKIEDKKAHVVVGARSAVFAPLENIGIIILDEEHSNSYKQENMPKYHATDIALFRAKYHNCKLILGSATPSIESYTRAKTRVYKLLEMKERVNNNLPLVTLIDMKDEIRKGNSILSELLKQKIEDRLNKEEQVIILLNRRGYSSVITCHECGFKETCPRCDIPLTYHKNTNIVRCHYCGYAKNKMDKCPECSGDNINSFGLGTQRLEEEINKSFEKAKTVRMDADTTTKKHSYENIINDFKSKKYNILIGTQMIAKGLDFSDVTLAAVINADSSLNIPDFRSAERTYSLLNQIAGRSGRSEKEGEVIFQGFNMQHYSIKTASTHDYLSFYNEEMSLRKILGYPPYYNLALVNIKSKDENKALEEATKITNFLSKSENIIVLGPSAATIPKINNFYYFKIIIKYKKSEDIYDKLAYIYEKYKKNKIILVEPNINPLSI
jgi:primosomal protein N''